MFKDLKEKVRLGTESYISMVLGLLVVIVIGIIIFNFFQSVKKGSPTTKEGEVITGEKTATAEGEKITTPGTHEVNPGENLWEIAQNYYGSGYNWVDIAKENNLNNPNHIETGQKIVIPDVEKKVAVSEITSQPSITEETYTVVKGDNLWSIAVRAYGNGFAWTKIAQANNLANPDLIHGGNVFIIPR